MSLRYQGWLCPPLRDTGIRVGQGGYHTVCELIGQSGWYAFERINNDGSVSHWFINQDGQHNNYIFPKQQLEAHLKRFKLGVNLNNVIITHELRDQIAQMRQKPPNTSVALEGGINSKL